MVANLRTLMSLSSFENKINSRSAESGEYGCWGIIMLFFAKKGPINNDVSKGGLWCWKLLCDKAEGTPFNRIIKENSKQNF